MSSSFSSSPSSLSYSDIDATTPAGCLDGVLRRILCSGSLPSPTQPFNGILESGSVVSDACPPKNQDKCSSPGIVARLMGLDSLPDFDRQNKNQLSRSRSVNSAENSDSCDLIHGGHRRVKSCMPIHMMPTFLELEDDNFLVLSFEDPGEGKQFRAKQWKYKKGFRELKQRNKEIKKEDRGAKSVQSETELCQGIYHKPSQEFPESKVDNTIRTPLTPENVVEEMDFAVEAVKKSRNVKCSNEASGRFKSDRMKVQRAGQECSSDDSSPVSVLDFDQYVIDPEDHTSVQESRMANSGSRRKLSPELDEYGNRSPQFENSLSTDDRKSEKAKNVPRAPRKVDCHNKKYLETWGEICRLAGEDVVWSDWICREVSKSDDYASISADFGLRILDHLLDELIDQLSGIHMKF